MTSPAKPTTNAAGPGAVLLTQSQPADMAGALAALGIASLDTMEALGVKVPRRGAPMLEEAKR